MKKVIFILVLLVLPFNVVFASSGALKGDSIVSCNGNYYGKHGKDNHWHLAEKKSGKWYPQGDSIYNSNPCGATTKKKTTTKKVTTTTKKKTTTSKSTTASTTTSLITTTSVTTTKKITTITSKSSISTQIISNNESDQNNEDGDLTFGDLLVTAGLISGGVWLVKKRKK